MYPCIDINLDGVMNNLKVLKSTCGDKGISFVFVTKVLAGNRPIVKYILENSDVNCIGDSRIKNLRDFRDFDVQKWLIRIPMISEADDVVEYADVSLNSEISVVRALNEAALKKGKKHKVVFMYECGDLREGCYYGELSEIIREALSMDGIEMYGIGTNLSCLNDTVPTDGNMAEFTDAVKRLENELGIKFEVVSGGASSSINMLFENGLPSEINNLRMGEGVFLGNVPVYDNAFPGAVRDCFVLNAEIIELKDKPSEPNVSRENAVLRRRAVLALGKQDIYISGLSCMDDKCSIAGVTSDHLVVDVTDSETDYKVGDVLSFRMTYNCLLTAMTSPYIEKNINY